MEWGTTGDLFEIKELASTKIRVPFSIDGVEIQNSPISGKGCFATKNIEKGSLIEKGPFIAIYKEQVGNRLMNIVFGLDNHSSAILLGWGSIYNHSDLNNSDWDLNANDNYFTIIANRDIDEGEEITVSYGDGWLESRGI